MKKIADEKIIQACKEHKFMSQACKSLGMHTNTFIRRAKKLGVYRPASKQEISASGGKVSGGRNKYQLSDILSGKHSQYPTPHLRKRLVAEGYKEYRCEECGITEYNGKPISLELDHIDGDNSNHKLNNLRILCPNCHSQTPTFKSKKRSLRKGYPRDSG